MRFKYLKSWLAGAEPKTARRPGRRDATLALHPLEDRSLLNGYIATGAGPGAQPFVSIRVDMINAVNQGGIGNVPGSGQPLRPTSDGQTDRTSQVFLAYTPTFLGGVNVAAGNFDGNYITPDSLVTAAGPGGGPHVIVWRMRQLADGQIVTDGIIDQFMAYDVRFTGGVNLATGDLDGDGRAELIVAPKAGGGPHVKIYSMNPFTNRFQVKYEFMAYDVNFRGGVSIASGQGYQTPVQVNQVLSTTFPNDFTVVPYDPPETRPGFNVDPTLDVPLTDAILNSVTVGSGSVQYLGANLLNSYGNLSYEPNVQGQPLVFARWSENSMNRPESFAPNVTYGPFVQIAGGNPPTIVPLTAALGQVNSRNQLVTGAGPGGGPHVKVFDFINDAAGFRINAQTGFMAFDVGFRGGVNVAIGDVVNLPRAATRGFLPDNTSTSVESRTFPFLRDVYQQFTPEIVVTTANGGGQARVFADFNPGARRTSVTELNLQPVLLDTKIVTDLNNPLENFTSLRDVSYFDSVIDPMFRGQIATAVSGLTFDGSSATALGSTVFAAGANPNNGPSRGAKVRIFTRLGTSPSYVNPGDVAPTTIAQNPAVDDFAAFTSGLFLNGVGGVAFGFGTLPVPTASIINLAPVSVTTLMNPVVILPAPPDGGGDGGGGDGGGGDPGGGGGGVPTP